MEFVNITNAYKTFQYFTISNKNIDIECFHNSYLIGLKYGDIIEQTELLFGMGRDQLNKLAYKLTGVKNNMDFTFVEFKLDEEEKGYILDWFIGFCKSKGCKVEGTFIK